MNYCDVLVLLALVPGIGTAQSSFLRCVLLATSLLVMVSGLSWAGSFQDVSTPGAAPLSTQSDLISRNACVRNSVRYSRTLGSMRGAYSFSIISFSTSASSAWPAFWCSSTLRIRYPAGVEIG